jgi:hypothetical protein
MFKTFMLFGLICVEDPSNQMFGENCFNFWEQPIVHYKSLGKCDRAGKAVAIQIRRELNDLNIVLKQGELWCIETTKTKNS